MKTTMHSAFCILHSAFLLLAAFALAAVAQATAQEYTFTTLAGPDESPGAVDGPGSAARFNRPEGVAVDSAGNVYVADYYNYTIRKVTPGGVVTTLAGLAGSEGSADGTGSAARFNCPYGVAVDSAGNVYVADTDVCAIRKVTPAGVVTTLAGLAEQSDIFGVAVDSAGNVYVADTANHTIRKVTPGGVVATLAGNASITNQAGIRIGGYADGTGSAARFNYPYGVAVDGAGNVYVADSGNSTIRKVTPGGVVTTLAGNASSIDWLGYPIGGFADGTASAARFNWPAGVAVDGAGNVYVADTANHTIRIGTTNTCPDAPTIDLAVGPVGQSRQLDTSPQTAVAWQWRLIRDPAGSSAALSAANVRNPTFTPDVADLYVFRLEATNAAGVVCIRTLELTAEPANLAVLASPQRLPDGSFQLTLIGQTNRSYTLQISTDLTTWTDWTNLTPASYSTPLTDPAAAHDPQRFYRARTP